MGELVQLPTFTQSADTEQVIQDVLRRKFEKMIIVVQNGDGIPIIVTRGASQLEAIGLTDLALALLRERLLLGAV